LAIPPGEAKTHRKADGSDYRELGGHQGYVTYMAVRAILPDTRHHFYLLELKALRQRYPGFTYDIPDCEQGVGVIGSHID